jgi:hypothetical protein
MSILRSCPSDWIRHRIDADYRFADATTLDGVVQLVGKAAFPSPYV